MLTAIVTQSNGRIVNVRLSATDTTDTTVVAEEATTLAAEPAAEGESNAEVKTAPNPIAPETKELAWAAGSFIVLFVLMRFFLFPKLKKGMEARYAGIRGDIEGADKAKSDARGEVAEYERALEAVRAEAAARVDKARQTVDAERQAKLAEVNSRIAAKRAEADAANAAARAAVRDQVAAAVSQVAGRAAELATGRTPDPSAVQSAVAAAMESAGSR
jgi:F-type H+-transporting ATPase subunit b